MGEVSVIFLYLIKKSTVKKELFSQLLCCISSWWIY